MNLNKGFFRLTLVLSIAIGIISAFGMMEREPYTRFKVKKTGEGLKELTITLLWFGKRNPDNFDFVEAFYRVATTNKRVIKGPLKIEGRGKDSFTLKEAISDPRFQGLIAEEQRKGLIDLDPEFAKLPKGKQDKVLLELIEMEKTEPRFAILEKTGPAINWSRFFLVMGIGFVSVWLVYAFIRWVIMAFIIGGFRRKANS